MLKPEVTKSCSNLLVQLECLVEKRNRRGMLSTIGHRWAPLAAALRRYSDQELLESCEARDPDFETTWPIGGILMVNVTISYIAYMDPMGDFGGVLVSPSPKCLQPAWLRRAAVFRITMVRTVQGKSPYHPIAHGPSWAYIFLIVHWCLQRG